MARNTSVSLGEHFAAFVDEQVESGRYASASDVLRAGLRLLEHEEAQLDHFRALIAEGLADIKAGRVVEDSDELWEAIDREVDERIKRDEEPGSHVLP
jgi:antitoxin ParD1/3/4